MSAPPSPLRIEVSGLIFPECPRWHDGHLYFSDMHAGRVARVSDEGRAETVVEVPNGPGGLGWLPDGRMLVVSMHDRKLLRLEAEGLTEHADLAGFAGGFANDLVVDPFGRAYVGNFGFDLDGGEDERTTNLLLVDVEGLVHVVAEGLRFPNGMVITPDGQELVVAESFGRRLTAFRIEPDGWLSAGRVWADLQPSVPDGICLDDAGGIWVSDPVYHQVFRVVEGGDITDRYETGIQGVFACMLGGSPRSTLYVCLAGTSDPSKTIREKAGQIGVIDVSVHGAGLP